MKDIKIEINNKEINIPVKVLSNYLNKDHTNFSDHTIDAIIKYVQEYTLDISQEVNLKYAINQILSVTIEIQQQYISINEEFETIKNKDNLQLQQKSQKKLYEEAKQKSIKSRNLTHAPVAKILFPDIIAGLISGNDTITPIVATNFHNTNNNITRN